MDMLDLTVTNIAAPSISQTLSGGQMLMQWLGAAYALAMGVFLIIGGRLGDKYGQRKLFLIGIAGFTVSSLSCGLSLNPTMIIISRLAQGAFGAMMIPQGMAIMAENFPRDMLTKAFAFFGPIISISMVLGPIFAGFLINADILHTGWRSIFLINVFLGVIGFIIAYRVLPKNNGDRSINLDWLGSGFLGGMMLFLLYGLIEGSNNGWSTISLFSIGMGILFLCLFSWRQTTATHPLIKPSLLKNRGFTAGLTLGLVYFAVVSGLNYIISIFLQLGLGASPFEASLEMSPLAIGVIISSIIVPKLINKLGREVISIGLLTTAVGLFLFYILINQAATITLWSLFPSIFIIGFGMGFCIGTLFDFAIGDISPDEAGSASGSLSAAQQLSGSIGIAAMTSVFFLSTKSEGFVYSMLQNLILIIVAMAVCFAIVRFLPKKRGEAQH
ncbi:MAG TPA: MFS transporter [Methanosarcina sp.]|nr:MFS transporter [Methanosarcina sp.]